MNKYRNKKVQRDGMKFDSIMEASRYDVLKEAEKNGEIEDLTLQPRFYFPAIGSEMYSPSLQPYHIQLEKGKRHSNQPIKYTADFSYKLTYKGSAFGLKYLRYLGYKPEELVVEDVKGSRKIMTDVFKIKYALMRHFYNTEVFIYIPSERVEYLTKGE